MRKFAADKNINLAEIAVAESASKTVSVSDISPEHAATGSMEKQYNMEEQGLSGSVWQEVQQRDDGDYHIRTFPNQKYNNVDTGEEILRKESYSHTCRSEVTTQRFMALTGQNVGQMSLGKNGQSIIAEFHQNYSATQNLPEYAASIKTLKLAIGVSILCGDYDRTPWNNMYDGQDVKMIDFGGSFLSSATGKRLGFPKEVNIEQVAFVLTNPQYQTGPVNDAYASVIDLEAANRGEIKILDEDLMRQVIDQISEITEGQIDAIIDSQWADLTLTEMQEMCHKALERISMVSPYYSPLKTEETYIEILEEYNGDICDYLKDALKGRRDSMVELFNQALDASEVEWSASSRLPAFGKFLGSLLKLQ